MLAAIVVIYSLAPTLFWVLVLLLVAGLVLAPVVAVLDAVERWGARRLRSLFTR